MVSAQPFSIHVEADASGTSIEFHREAWIAEARVDGSLSYTIDDQDASGVVLVESFPNEQHSPLAIAALRLFPALAVS